MSSVELSSSVDLRWTTRTRTSYTTCGSVLPNMPISITIALLENERMPIELDYGIDDPLLGPEGRLNLAMQLKIADQIVRKYGRRAKMRASARRVRAVTARISLRSRRGRRHRTR